MLKFIIFVGIVAAASEAIPQRRNPNSYFREARTKVYQNTVVDTVLKHAPRNAKLISFRSTGPISDEKLRGSLIDNATLIRENIVGGFDCSGRNYGYYADPLNGCQVFHICVNMKQIFPEHFKETDVLQFSFICPKYTIFTQDAMVCSWVRSAIPCEVAEQLYYLNNNFFVIPPKDVKKVPVDTQGSNSIITPP